MYGLLVSLVPMLKQSIAARHTLNSVIEILKIDISFTRSNPFHCVIRLSSPFHDSYLTFTTLWAFSADGKLMIFFLFFPENRI